MNTEVEDLLREGMERFTRDLRAPVGLTRRATRRRRRTLTLRSTAAVAAAVTVGAVLLVAVQLPGAPRGGTRGPAAPAAYVVKRVDSALSAAEPGEIAQMTVTTRGAVIPGGTSTTAEEWSYGNQWRSVTNSLAGHPLYDEGFTTSSVFTLVSYLTQTWARQHSRGYPSAKGYPVAVGGPVAAGRPKPVYRPHGCEPELAAFPLLFRIGLPGIGLPASPFSAGPSSASSMPATVAKDLRTAVACGTLTVAGWRQRVDGIEAIELKSRRSSLISETIWVSPGTDLPVRVVVSSGPGKPVLRQTADITWLRPTPQNLANLTVPIPAGFRRVSLAKVVRPILQQIAGGQGPIFRGLCLPSAGLGCAGGPIAYKLGPERPGPRRIVVP